MEGDGNGRVGARGEREAGREDREPSVLPHSRADGERRHLADQRDGARRDATFVPEARPQARYVDQGHSPVDRLDPRGEVVEAIEHGRDVQGPCSIGRLVRWHPMRPVAVGQRGSKGRPDERQDAGHAAGSG